MASPFRYTHAMRNKLIAVGAVGLASWITSGCDKPAAEDMPAANAAQAPVSQPAVKAAPSPGTQGEPAHEPSPEKKASARPAHWGYAGEVAPTNWAALSPAYEACAKGIMQSPVDIPSKAAGKAAEFKMSYGTSTLRIAHHEHVDDIVDNGHTLQVTVDEGSTLTTVKDTYQLKQFHFHTPSENAVDGKSYPMEVHFVHQSAEGNFAVLSSFFSEGDANENMAKLIAHFPAEKGGETRIEDQSLDLQLHLPKDSDSYHFLGSFTTPPCTENVEWIVLKKPASASREQLAAFEAKLGHNNRPLQKWQDRSVSVNALDAAGK